MKKLLTAALLVGASVCIAAPADAHYSRPSSAPTDSEVHSCRGISFAPMTDWGARDIKAGNTRCRSARPLVRRFSLHGQRPSSGAASIASETTPTATTPRRIPTTAAAPAVASSPGWSLNRLRATPNASRTAPTAQSCRSLSARAGPPDAGTRIRRRAPRPCPVSLEPAARPALRNPQFETRNPA